MNRNLFICNYLKTHSIVIEVIKILPICKDLFRVTLWELRHVRKLVCLYEKPYSTTIAFCFHHMAQTQRNMYRFWEKHKFYYKWSLAKDFYNFHSSSNLSCAGLFEKVPLLSEGFWELWEFKTLKQVLRVCFTILSHNFQ